MLEFKRMVKILDINLQKKKNISSKRDLGNHIGRKPKSLTHRTLIEH